MDRPTPVFDPIDNWNTWNNIHRLEKETQSMTIKGFRNEIRQAYANAQFAQADRFVTIGTDGRCYCEKTPTTSCWRVTPEGHVYMEEYTLTLSSDPGEATGVGLSGRLHLQTKTQDPKLEAFLKDTE
jgi:hypothetical protein